MKLYIGGLGHGQAILAEKETGLKPETCSEETAFNAKSIDNFEEIIKEIVKKDGDAQEFAKKLLLENPDVVIVANEIGFGIHPLERRDRRWREQTGRALCILAEGAESVTRVYCGIGQKIK
ncbi:MAG: bifunctional adenosylcobinamide kinase/adenosylcobinamide-phosphate guanylyltransferase [Lachnospiraceae bacterium]|nr:bifunctional adenosylcobinamide kinase/adenosylcobinamide-phosphate guanylyltransferase [Lachnospiraceae bacterium]